MGISFLAVRKIVLEDSLKYNGETLLKYRIEYPQFRFSSGRICHAKVNRFYKDKALELQRYCKTDLFSMAIEQYKDDVANNFPIRIFEVQQVYNVTYLRACIISIYFDRYEYTGGAHGNTTRTSQTWQLQRCGFIPLKQLVRCPPDYKSYIFAQIEAQIRQNPDIYFENYEELVKQTFTENSFFCTSKGIVIYYQQYDIAPYSSGIREFLLPYGDCVVNPKRLCY